MKFFCNKHYSFGEDLITETILNILFGMAQLNFMNIVEDGINNENSVTKLFLDITTTFDTVNCQILLTKLQNWGIRRVVCNDAVYITGGATLSY